MRPTLYGLMVSEGPPTILHVAAVPFTARNLLLPQMQHLRSSGFRVRLACAAEPGGWKPDLAEFDPLSLAFPRQLRVLPLVRALQSLPGVVRRSDPEIVHLHSPAAALPARLLPRAALPAKTRVVYTVHGFAHQWKDMTTRDNLLAFMEKKLAPRTDMLLFQSDEDYHRASDAGFSTELRLIGNGVEDAWFKIPPPPRQRLTVLFSGRLVREKGVLDLLEAVALVPELRLVVAGAALDSDRDNVEQQVKSRAAATDLAGRVEFLGMVSRAELVKAMSAVSALVLPSYREGVPRSVIEALAAGRPAVVTDIRGCRELVKHEVNGFVVPAGRPDLLASALARLASQDHDEFQAMCRSARSSADPSRRESHVFDRIVDAYGSLGVAP